VVDEELVQIVGEGTPFEQDQPVNPALDIVVAAIKSQISDWDLDLITPDKRNNKNKCIRGSFKILLVRI